MITYLDRECCELSKEKTSRPLIIASQRTIIGSGPEVIAKAIGSATIARIKPVFRSFRNDL
ncbi:hypothetical protein [Methanococcoides methylutens]|uniref:hypothetical protein n=1 Tax=Methanococcoides methylutens TaxID=2226 RepID=UPI001082F4E6|nr:hypothetical protein [Methanococcoides methylutens]